MSLTRRDVSKLLLSGTAVGLSPLPLGAATPQEWAARFEKDLRSHLLPGCDGTLTLEAFGFESAERARMAAVVRLDWPPGMRKRRFDSVGDKPDTTYNALLNQALFEFAKAWPGCVV